MNRYPWFRMYAEARTDAKLRTLTDAEFRVWFNLLCYASEQDERGTIPPTDPFLLAVEVAGGDEALLEETMTRLVMLRMVDVGDSADTITFSKFTERQYDKPSDAPDATRERKARQRAKQRESRVTTAESRPLSRDVTPSHAPEKRREEESKEYSPPTPPPGEETQSGIVNERRREVWDALVEGTGIKPETSSERSRFGKSVAELLALDATRPEILKRCASYRQHYPNTTITDRALVNNWSTVAGAPPRASPNGRPTQADHNSGKRNELVI
jgi:hypothetical protein